MPLPTDQKLTTLQQVQQLEYAFKKLAASKMKTDSPAYLSLLSEPNFTFPIIRGKDVWTQSNLLTNGPAGPSAPVTKRLLPMISAWGTTSPFNNSAPSNAALIGQAWIPYTGSFGSASPVTNWVSDSFNSAFKPTFRIAPNTVTVTDGNKSSYPEISPANVDFPFTFDFQSGIALFLAGVPGSNGNISIGSYTDYKLQTSTLSGTNTTTTYVIWVEGYTYSGQTLDSGGGSAGSTGATGPGGSTGPVGPTGPSLLMQFDGGIPSTFTALTVPNPNFDCGGVIR